MKNVDWQIGAMGPERCVGPLTRTDFVRYAGASGDFNPIHHDEAFAQAAGFANVFGHGLLTAGILGGFVADWLGRTRKLRELLVERKGRARIQHRNARGAFPG